LDTLEAPRRWPSMDTFDVIMIGTGSLGIAATLAMLWWTS
jgi:hypothetical protein